MASEKGQRLKLHWTCDLDFCKFVAWFILLSLSSFVFGKTKQDAACGKTDFINNQGTITSPGYPTPFDEEISCEWQITSSSSILIELLDLDIAKDEPCLQSSCCSQHWLSVPHEGGRGADVLCGNNRSETRRVSQSITTIKYFGGKSKRGRGFKLKYSTDIHPCQGSDLQCMNGKCVRNDSFCNGIIDCSDGSDEKNCIHITDSGSKYGFIKKKIEAAHLKTGGCTDGSIPCALSPSHCYYPDTQLCNGQFDCPKGEDELSCAPRCPKQLACSSGDGCYYPVQRCNSIRNCRDNSDETGCPEEPCAPLQFVCLNGLCVSGSALCDGDDDCGDLSDEENCTKSSLMTAAIMGLLACIFLFCIGLSCLYRVYTARLRASAGFVQRLEPESVDEDFVYREPPPAYSVAINDTRVISYPAPEIADRFFEPDQSTRSHRSRSSRRNRRRQRSSAAAECSSRSRPRPVPILSPPVSTMLPPPQPRDSKTHLRPPAAAVPGHIELCGLAYPHGESACADESPCSSPSLSPSRESVTSSTSLEDHTDLVRSCHS